MVEEIDLSRNDGITPLIMAAAMNHHEAVDVLLDFGINPNEESKVPHNPYLLPYLRAQSSNISSGTRNSL